MMRAQSTVAWVAGLVLAGGGVPWAVNEWMQLSQTRDALARSEEHLRQSVAAEAEGDLAVALRAVELARETSPGDASLRRRSAELLARQIIAVDVAPTTVELVRMAQVLDAARRGDDSSAEVLVAAGRIALLRGRDEVAARLFQEAVERFPDHAAALLFLGDLQLRQSRFSEAQSALRHSLELDDTDARTRLLLGETLLRLQKPKEALPYLSTAAQVLAGSARARFALGKANAALGEWAASVRSFEGALSLDASLPDLHRLLGDAYQRIGRPQAASRAYRQAWDKTSDREAFRKLGRLAYQAGDAGTAAQVFGELRLTAEDDPEPRFVLGLLERDRGHFDAARAHWEACVRLATGGAAASFAANCTAALNELPRLAAAHGARRAGAETQR